MDEIKQKKEEYKQKFLADVEKLKAEKEKGGKDGEKTNPYALKRSYLEELKKTVEKEGKQPAEVEIYCIDSQGNKRTLEEIHSVFSGSISYKAENEQRKKLGIKSNP